MLQTFLKTLAKLRSQKNEADTNWKTLNAKFKKAPVYKNLYHTRKNLERDIKALEDEIRVNAVNEFDGTNKQLVANEGKTVVGIQESEYYQYEQPDAYAWCEKNAPLALVTKLDTAYFEDTLKQLERRGDLPDFVTKVKDVKATIATDLSFLLEEHTHNE